MPSRSSFIQICVSLAILVAGGSGWAAGDDSVGAKPKVASASSLARLTVIDGEYDFGLIRAGEKEKVSHTFRFKNTGEENLKILKIKPSCGCTRAEPSSKDIPPGEEATLEAEMKLKGKSGSSTVSVTMHTNDPTKPTHVFRIKGTILTPFRIVPSVLDFGPIGKGETRSRTLNMTSQLLEGDPEVRIRALSTSDPNIQAVTKEENRRQVRKGENSYTEIVRPVEVTLTGEGELGQKQAELIVATDSVEKPTHTIRVRWKVEGDIEKRPGKVYVSRIKNRTIDRPLTLRSRSGKSFHVSSVKTLIQKGEGDFLSVEPTSDSNDTVKKFLVRIKDDGIERKKETCQGEIIFETDHPEMKEVKVPFVAVFR